MKSKNLWRQLQMVVGGLVLFSLVTFLTLPTAASGPAKPQLQIQPQPIRVTISLYNSPVGADRLAYQEVIAYFADAVYEMSNGAHRLGRIEIYSGGEFADQANIVWTATGWPQANISGYATTGQRVSFCDANTEGENYIGDQRQNGGYTLGHEWGHYYYSIYDEYLGSEVKPGDLGHPDPNDQAVQFSIMNNQRNAIGDLNWLNFSTALNSTANNAQRRVYEASAWETLTRPPSSDPAEPPRRYDAARLYYPELAQVAPAQGASPSIEVNTPDGQTAARGALEFVWMEQSQGGQTLIAGQAAEDTGFVRQIVIDRSAVMAADDKLANVKAAAELLIDEADIGDTIGVISFDGTVTVVQPLTLIVDQTTKDTIQTAIEGISIGNSDAAIGDAAQQALDGLTTVANNSRQGVYLIAGSPNSTGSQPSSVIPAYQAASVLLFTFGYEVNETTASTLYSMASATDGDFRFIGGANNPDEALNDLLDGFESADQTLSPIVDVNLTTGAATATSTPFTVSLPVDSSLGELEVEVSYQGPQADLTLDLLDPNNVSAGTPECTVSATGGDTDTLCFFSAANPISGTWVLSATATGADVPLEYWAGGVPKDDDFTYAALVESASGNRVVSNQAVVLEATLVKDLLPIAGSVVDATLEAPDGQVTSFTMRDDGVSPDRVAEDGLYAGQLTALPPGDYQITVKFDNSNGTAVFTEEGFAIGVGTDGKQRAALPPVPVEENFSRFAELQINVVQVRSVYLPTIQK